MPGESAARGRAVSRRMLATLVLTARGNQGAHQSVAPMCMHKCLEQDSACLCIKGGLDPEAYEQDLIGRETDLAGRHTHVILRVYLHNGFKHPKSRTQTRKER